MSGYNDITPEERARAIRADQQQTIEVNRLIDKQRCVKGLEAWVVPKYSLNFILALKSLYQTYGINISEIRLPYIAYQALTEEVNCQIVALGFGVSGEFKISTINIRQSLGSAMEIVAHESKK